MKIDRPQVLWFGPPPPESTIVEFERRDLGLTPSTGEISDEQLALSCAAIFSYDHKNKGESIGLVKAHAAAAAAHGLLIVLRADEQSGIRLLQGHLPSFPTIANSPNLPRPIKQFSIEQPAHRIAEWAARHEPGPRLNLALEIKGDDMRRENDDFLLRRAFGDCKAITVRSLKAGFSGARVFVVYAEFPDVEVANFPLPYFAKIDSCEHILKEFGAYERLVSHYIPFGHRPNFEAKRCFLGVTDGILVGDFIDESIPLADIIRSSGARGIIHSLFDDALRGWRDQAFRSDQRLSFREIRKNIVKPARMKDQYVTTAKTFGATSSKMELVHLLNRSGTYSYRRGVMHGDLHTKNIHVRNGEAVLIDFCKSDIGAPAADLASLEVAICFSMEADIEWKNGSYEQSARFAEWRRQIDALFVFKKNEFGTIPPLHEQPCDHTWMWSACIQLRLMAHYIEPSERAYASLLAAYLLRMAMFPDSEGDIVPGSPDAIVRAYAYRCAERILLAMTSPRKVA